MKVPSGERSTLSPTQRSTLIEVVSGALDNGAQIPWRNMVESSEFANLTYATLRREGKAVLRQLRQQGKVPIQAQSGPVNRRADEAEQALTEPKSFEDNEHVNELEALVVQKDDIIADRNRQIKALKQELNAVVSEAGEQFLEGEKLQKQVESLHHCISELSAIIAGKDVLLAEASAHYDKLKERIRQLVSE
ncbi:hypothetical protein PInf_012166 [Phytophthora infestans]|nr:hypothetical protein PInf_012166 [Phytophthora infestans]